MRVAWALIALVAGPTFADALDHRSRSVQVVSSTLLWVVWAAALAAALVPRTVSLTIVRVAAPAALVAVAWAASRGDIASADMAAVALAAVATVASLAPTTGDYFVNGSSYGDERRMPLRVPGPLLFGPLELVWAVAVGGLLAGPLLLASQQWLPGAAAAVVGVPLAALALRSLHGLSRRWIVFVPAGMVVHDPLSIADPILLPRRLVRSFGPAPADSDGLDLTQRSLGLVLQVELAEPIDLLLSRPGRRKGETVMAARLLVSPTRPGAVLAEAGGRRLPVG
jgi:hypothetical protein